MDPSSKNTTEPQASDDPLIGQLVGDRYEILAPLARGGMGRVYRAMQVQLSREVALKVLDASADVEPRLREDFTRRFLLEASSLAKLTHPNTIVIYDYGDMGEASYFIAMELLQGRTLRQLIKAEYALAAERTIRIGIQAAGSLAEAHDHGLIHRDLKPGNLFLTKRGDDAEFVKVLDFGLVKHRHEGDDDQSHTGFMVGTPRYMAPEQIVGDPVTPATDVYGLGATLYHMLAGRPPFEADNRFDLLVMQADSVPEPIASIYPSADLPAGLEQVIMRCLRKRPVERYSTMRELAAALVDCSSYSGSFPFGLTGSSPHVAKAGALGTANVPSAPDTSQVDSTRLSKPRPRPNASAAAAGPPDDAVPATHVHPPDVPDASMVAPRSNRGMLLAVLVAIAVSLSALGAVVAMFVLRPAQPAAPAPVVALPSEPPAPVVVPPPEIEARAGAVDTRVMLTTEPETARVRRGDVDLGDSPLTLVIPEGATWQVEVSAPGHEPRTLAVQGGQGQLQVRLEPERRPSGRRPTSTPPSTGSGRRSTTDNRDPWAN